MKGLRYHESIQRGYEGFPVEYHHVDQDHPRYRMPCHWHEEQEIIRVISGCFLLVLEGETIPLHAGEAAYIASGRLHAGEPQACVYECVVFDMRLLIRPMMPGAVFVYDADRGQVEFQTRFTAEDQAVQGCLGTLFEALQNREAGHELIAAGSLMCFLGLIRQKGLYTSAKPAATPGKGNLLKLKAVFEMIESRPQDPPSLQEMASAAGMSRSHFCTCFRRVTHHSPTDYIGLYRIERACGEMMTTDKNVSEIAMDLGYCDLSSFIRSFRRYRGMPPGEYLKRIRSGAGPEA